METPTARHATVSVNPDPFSDILKCRGDNALNFILQKNNILEAHLTDFLGQGKADLACIGCFFSCDR